MWLATQGPGRQRSPGPAAQAAGQLRHGHSEPEGTAQRLFIQTKKPPPVNFFGCHLVSYMSCRQRQSYTIAFRFGGFLGLFLPFACLGSAQSASRNATVCFSHDNCTNPSEFCAWVKCQSDDGSTYNCGSCRPCSMCMCNSNSTDNMCPQDRCPSTPAFGVLYWQGIFYGSVPMITDPTFTCFIRLAIFGNLFFFLQLPVSNTHPASSAALNFPNSSECTSFTQAGVLKSTPYVNGEYILNLIVTSEGIVASEL